MYYPGKGNAWTWGASHAMIRFFGFFHRSGRTAGKRRASAERGRHRRLGIESLESRQLLSVSFSSTPASQTVVAGDGSLNVALNAKDTAGDAVSYQVNVVSSSLSRPVTATVMPSSNPTMTMAVTGTSADGTKFSGDMVFSLFSNYVPAAVTPISALAGKSFYNGLEFFRVISNFMAQTGSPTNNGLGGSGTTFDDDYDPHLQFTGPGILAMANSGPNSNSSQFFITSPEEASPYAPGSFRYTIIGYLLSGNNILTDIMNVPVATNPITGFPDPVNPVTMTKVTMGTDNQDGVLQLSAAAGTTGSEVVTVTATSVENGVRRTATSPKFTVTVSPQNYTDPPYIDRPVSPITTTVGTPVDFTIPATNVNGNAITYAATPYDNDTSTIDASSNIPNTTIKATAVNSSGQWSLDPSTAPVGVYSLLESVMAANPVGPENTSADTEFVPVYVDPAAPTGISMVPGPGATSTTITDLNNTPGKTLEFNVTGVTPGDTVQLYSDGTLIPTTQTTLGTSVLLTTTGTVTLTAGPHAITVTQTLEDQPVSVGNLSTTTNLVSPASTLSITVDTTPPVFNSTPVTSATVNVPYSYQVTTATDSAGAVTYSLISPASGMSINSSSGLIAWTPAAGQGPAVSVDVQATDPAGNTAQQQFTINLASTPVGSSASLSGCVYLAPSNSGIRVSSSKGLGGVTVRLLLENSSGTFTEVAGKSPIQTKADGSYCFSNLAAGTYQIQETTPPVFVEGRSTLGSIGGVPSGTIPQTDTFQVTVAASQKGTGYNFSVQGVVPRLYSLRLMLASASMTGDELEQSLETAPSVNLAGSARSTATTNFSTTFSAGGSPVAIASPAASIASPDSPTQVSMTVTLTDPLDGLAEQLHAVTTGTSITASYANGVLLLSGVADTSTYQAVLRSITYSDTAPSPTLGDRTIDVMVDDGTLDSAVAVSTVNVLPISRAPRRP